MGRSETASTSDALSFEDALERLEEVVERLEEGGIELEEALAVFEEGVELSRRCATQLDDAERRIEVLAADGSGEIRPFEEQDVGEG